MGNFEASITFVARVMHNVRSHEIEMKGHEERVRAFIFSRPVFSILSAGGILLGIINILRIALILISPAMCL
jgi:hypothetical protein